MREIRPSGSEGGGTETNRSSLPLSWLGLGDDRITMFHPKAPTGRHNAARHPRARSRHACATTERCSFLLSSSLLTGRA
jgi:hypothetical protein